jgi:hypothetical protein
MSQQTVFQWLTLNNMPFSFRISKKNAAKMFAGVITFDKPERDHTHCLNDFAMSISFHKVGCDSLKAIKVWVAPHVSCQEDTSKRILYCTN